MTALELLALVLGFPDSLLSLRELLAFRRRRDRSLRPAHSEPTSRPCGSACPRSIELTVTVRLRRM